jgi:hypothetical protein
LLQKRENSHVYVASTDLSGQLRGTSISRDKLCAALDGEIEMSHNFHLPITGDTL